jgi:hypothetical protein
MTAVDCSALILAGQEEHRRRERWETTRSALDAAKIAEGQAAVAWIQDRMPLATYRGYRGRLLDALDRECEAWDAYVTAAGEAAALAARVQWTDRPPLRTIGVAMWAQTAVTTPGTIISGTSTGKFGRRGIDDG